MDFFCQNTTTRANSFDLMFADLLPNIQIWPKSKIPLTLAVSEWNTSSAAKRVCKFINDNVVKMKEWTRKTYWQNRNCQKTEVVPKRSCQEKVDITCMFVTRNRIRLSCRAGNSSWSSKFQISEFFRKMDWNYKIDRIKAPLSKSLNALSPEFRIS